MPSNNLFFILILLTQSNIFSFSLQRYARYRLLKNIKKNKSNLFSFDLTKLWDNRLFSLFRRRVQVHKNQKLIVDFDPKKDWKSELYPGVSYLEKKRLFVK